MKTKGKTLVEVFAAEELIKRGAKLEKKEDTDGRTRSGWWMEDVFLSKDAGDALRALNGNA